MLQVAMRWLLSIGVLSVTLSAQEPVKPPLSPRITTATRQVNIFTDLETQLLQAVKAKDQAALKNLISEDCMIEMPDADPLAADDWVADILGKDYALKAFLIRQVSVLDQGDSAIVKFDRVQKATYKNQPEAGEF